MTDYHLDDMVAEYLDLTDRIEQLGQRRDQIKTQLRELGTGKHVCENLDATVTVSAPAKRFDAATFDKIVTDDQLRAACTETTISGKLAKQVLAPAIYDLCTVEGGEPRVTVR